MAFTDSVEFAHLTGPLCSKIQQVLVAQTKGNASARSEMWSWLRSFTLAWKGRVCWRCYGRA